jgi:hypothetical protein
MDIDIKKNKLIPETKINITQLNPINNVCPKSGCKINKIIIIDVIRKEDVNFSPKPFNFWLEIIEAIITIKKGFTSSTGCNLGKKNKSNHLVDPFTCTPIMGTKSNKIKEITKKKVEILYSDILLINESVMIINMPIKTKNKCLKKKK